jgi:hypothetical protein
MERLTRHLNKGVSNKDLKSYLSTIRRWVPSELVIHIDDSDVIQSDGYKFESLGFVRDGSKSISTKSIYEKGYRVTEACALADLFLKKPRKKHRRKLTSAKSGLPG